MMNYKDLLSIPFYKKSAFTGSRGNMRYRIEKAEIEENDTTIEKLKVATWPGPFAYDKTDSSKIQFQLFDFSDEGLKQIATFLDSAASEY